MVATVGSTGGIAPRGGSGGTGCPGTPWETGALPAATKPPDTPAAELRPGPRSGGFTLIELLVVLAIIATLLTIAVPRYFGSLENSKEATLRQSLAVMREAIDHHLGDTGKYPASLEELVDKRYLRALPVDPITERADSWRTQPPSDPAKGGIADVKSGAEGNARDGTPYASW